MKKPFALSLAFLLFSVTASASELAQCRAVEIIDSWLFEDALDTGANSEIRLTESMNGYRFFIGQTTFENWEYCNIEPMKNKGPDDELAFRIDDYRQDLTVFLTIQYPVDRSSKRDGMISFQLNPAKPAAPVARIQCD